MIREYDKRDLLKNFPKSKLNIRPLATTLTIANVSFHVPAKEHYILREDVKKYYDYVLSMTTKERIFDNFFKIVMLQSWPMSYIPGKTREQMYTFLRNYVISRMEEYNIIYIYYTKKKKINDGEITIIRLHMVGRYATENFFDYSTSPFYRFIIDGKEYMVSSFEVQPILTLIENKAKKAQIIEEIKKVFITTNAIKYGRRNESNRKNVRRNEHRNHENRR